jgi:NAD(P)H-hydrate repair Nnr-like enzyme with NAD(P)H-hydrate epimerase domain
VAIRICGRGERGGDGVRVGRKGAEERMRGDEKR